MEEEVAEDVFGMDGVIFMAMKMMKTTTCQLQNQDRKVFQFGIFARSKASVIYSLQQQQTMVPLHCDQFPDSDGSYDLFALPLQDPKSFLEQAERVQSAPTGVESERLATELGIKGLPLLSTLCSLSFPTLFPYDFMHLIWANLILNLIWL